MSKQTIKYISAVMVFGLFTAVCLFFGKTESVFWEIYAYTLKDSFIISLIIGKFISDKNFVSRLTSIAIGSYFIMPFLIRLFCAYRSQHALKQYEAYRAFMKNDNYTLLLTLALFLIMAMIYKAVKNDTRRN